MADSNLNIVISARDEASGTLNSFSERVNSLSENVGNFLKQGLVPLGIAFAATSGIIYKAIDAYDEHQRVLSQLDAVLRSTGGAAGVTKEAVEGLSNSLQKQTTYARDSITGAQDMLLTFTAIGKGVFPETTKAILDMSTAMNQDLKTSTIQIGKALEDPVKGLVSLHRVGVEFTEQQKEQIKTMVTAGNTMGAQKVILAELNKEFGGSAAAAAETYGGKMKQLQNSANDLSVTLGGGLAEAITKVTGGMNNGTNALDRLNTYFKEHRNVLLGVSVALIALATTFGVLLVAAMITVAGTVGVVIAVIGALVAASAFLAVMIVTHWNQIMANIKEAVAFWENVVKVVITFVLQTIQNKVEETKKHFIDAFKAIENAVMGVVHAIEAVISAAAKLASSAFSGIKNALHFQHGGIVPGSSGEAVPIIAHAGERISSATGSDVNSKGGTGGGMNVTLNFTGNISLDSDSRVKELADKIAIVLGRQNELAAKGVSF